MVGATAIAVAAAFLIAVNVIAQNSQYKEQLDLALSGHFCAAHRLEILDGPVALSVCGASLVVIFDDGHVGGHNVRGLKDLVQDTHCFQLGTDQTSDVFCRALIRFMSRSLNELPEAVRPAFAEAAALTEQRSIDKFYLNKAPDHIAIDLRTGSIGKVAPNSSLAEITAILGADHVEMFIFEEEGTDHKGYYLDFGSGHKVTMTWSGASVHDPYFKTDKALGVGSTLKEFKSEFADGELVWAEETHSIWSETYKFHLGFGKDTPPRDDDKVIEIDIGKFPSMKPGEVDW